MATTHHLFSVFVALTILSVASAAGITIDLIHRDSPNSPLSSNAATSHVDKLYNTFQRSILRAREISRATRVKSSSSPVNAPVISAGGEYLVDVSIGTPPTRFLGIADTGSDLTWTQCKPCVQCFEQELPIFDPSKSTSYDTLTCDSDACQSLLPTQQGCSADNTCAYQFGYGDRSSTIGDLATETLTVGRPGPSPAGRLKGFTFGCGRRNQGTFAKFGSGIVGLGQGPLSLPSQTKDIPAFGGKFAYCLIPFDGKSKAELKSKISFGDDAKISGDDVVSTPVVSGQVNTFYYLTLESVSVGNQTLPFRTQNGSGSGLGSDDEGVGSSDEGNMIIDSGTTLTFLPEEMFEGLLSELKAQIEAEIVEDPREMLQLCYKGEIEVPTITFHFAGADLEVGSKKSFIEVAENVKCLSVLPADNVAIFGNVVQTDFVVAHDLDAKTVSFKATDCKTYQP